jgi:hypothetical protein
MNYRNPELAEAVADIAPCFQLRRFDELKIGTERAYLVKGLIPRHGLVVIWGPPKCGKSFWTFDLAMHVALDWPYRDRRVQQGPVVYCAFEGGSGYNARAEAFRQRCLAQDHQPIDFYLLDAQIDLVADHAAIIAAIRAKVTAANAALPACVVLDTLNRSLAGSESNDKDMALYIRAADAIREAFDCVVVIVHHCGVEGTRPRGHTSLTGAVDAQLAVRRDAADNVIVTVEWMKDGAEGDVITSRLERVEVGADIDGDPISSCVIVPAEAVPASSEPKLSKNQQTMFSILHAAGPSGLTGEQWNAQAREAGLGERRKADLVDFKMALKGKGLVRPYGDRWTVAT